MKRALLIFTAMLLALLLSLSLVACGGTEDNPSTPPSGGNGDAPGGDTPDTPDSPSEPEQPETPAVDTSAIDSFVQAMGNNYTAFIYEGMDSTAVRYLVCENGVRIYRGLYDTKGEIITVAGGRYYSYNYNPADAMWHKTDAEAVDFDSLAKDKLVGAEWTAFDSETGAYTGSLDGRAVSLRIVEGDSGAEIRISGEEYSFEISMLGATSLEMPESDRIVDESTPAEPLPDTPNPDEPSPDEPGADGERYIYTVDESGEYSYNIPLLQELLEKWMKGDNQWSEDIAAKRLLSTGMKTERIIFIQPRENYIGFGALISRNGESSMMLYCIEGEELLNAIADGSARSESGFAAALKRLQLANIAPWEDFSDNATVKLDAAISEKDLSAILGNTLKRLSTVGTQSRADADGVIYNGLEGAELVLCAKGEYSEASAGAGLGWMISCDLYTIFRIGEGYELVTIHVAATESPLKFDYVLKETEGKWIVFSVDSYPIDSGNAEAIIGEPQYYCTPSDEGGFVITADGRLIDYVGDERDITIPSSVTSIGEAAFYECNLVSISIPSYVRSIDKYAFALNRSLVSISFAQDSPIEALAQGVLSGCSALETVELPNGLKEIGNAALFGCGLRRIDLSGTAVTRIVAYAFSSCEALRAVELPETLTHIEDSAFSDCAIESISLPASLVWIGKEAFKGCTHLTSVYFGVESGWQVESQSGAAPIAISVSSPSTNAANLKENYVSFTWKRTV